MEVARLKAKEFFDYVEETRSKSTVKLYKRGLTLFSEYYKKDLDQILEERRQDLASSDLKKRKRFVRQLERFHSWLIKKGYPKSSASTYSVGLMAMFRYFEMPITLPPRSEIGKKIPSTKDFTPSANQYRAMYRVADKLQDKLIISMGKDLAWRIGDFLNQRKDQLPNLDEDAPIAYDLVTKKEDVLSKSFLSYETVKLLKEYLATLPQTNVYLFPSANGGKGHLDGETVTRYLRKLAKKADIVIPKRKRLRFHAFRRRFLSTCADLGIDINIAKILVGKNVEYDMLTYLSEVEHRKAFLKVQDVLRLTQAPTTTTTRPTTELEKRVRDLERIIISMVGMGYGEQVREAKKVAKAEGLEIEMRRTVTASKWKPTLRDKLEEMKRRGDKLLWKLEEQEKLDETQRKEYERIIRENNNNNE